MIGTILILDDSLTVRMDLSEALEAEGFRTLPCATAQEARVALSQEPVAAIILDVLLPDVDGIEFLQEIRADPHYCAITVLMLSSEAEVKDRVRGMRMGANDYIGKPYDTGHVVAKVRDLVRNGTSVVGEGTTLLVIDDSATTREDLRQIFEGAGYRVRMAASGEEGLRVAADCRPHAIVVDGMLPGIDGATVIRHLRLDAALRGVPCILLTGSDDSGAELRALDAGADAFVRKEDAGEVVLAKLAAVLRRSIPTSAADEATSLSGPKKILVVDDSITYLEMLAEMLRSGGYDVVLAQSGEEALELLAVQSVDCILLDLLMPGLSGQETCRRIKAAPGVRDVPLIMLTALEDRAAMIQGLGAGADDYIQKSSEFEILKARILAQMRRKQFEDENRHIRESLLRKELEATEARAAHRLAETRAALVGELERKNQELEAFSYSVSHDLRAPLRGIDGFSLALLEDYGDKLDAKGQSYLHRVRAATQRMGNLIEDLLDLSRVGRAELLRAAVDLATVARTVANELARREPERCVQFEIQDRLMVDADPGLMQVVLENLLGNAWKFSAQIPQAKISVGTESNDRGLVYFVRDNGVGFDMAYAGKLFSPFQRLHREIDFAGTGIGLATVHRIIDRHGGRIWAQSAIGQGTTLYFTLPPERTGGQI